MASRAQPHPVPSGPPISVIVLSDHGFINGGQAKIAIESALHLKRHGLDVCFVAGVGPMDERLVDAGIECHAIAEHDILSDPKRFRAATRGIWNLLAAKTIGACIAARDPQSTVVHTHGWAKALSPSIGPVIRGMKSAHVYTLHEYFLACPTGGFYHHAAAQICTRRPLGFDCLTTNCDARSRSHKAWRVARQAVLTTAGGLPRDLREIIYLAPEQRAIMAPFMSAEARWHLLPNPVGPQPVERVRVEDNDLFLYIGRLSPEKGAEVAARAARLAGVRIAFCGEGEARPAIEAANPDAMMLGWLEPEELSKWVGRARCLVFPSLWYECYPLVVADALRAGLPVIVSKSSVAASSVEDGVNGLHRTAGDAADWADAMRTMQSDEVALSFGQAAFEAGRKLLDYDRYTRGLIGIYEQVLSRKYGAVAETRSVPA